ncbi:unnamed protein product [Musa acuminata subsp. malaccensis]|uniref:(wild Malaysian banana) hypothetical protein n=1 Tax=Musa acuminata subsp. malaccensis TaxID=214687 RepID=A0A804KVB4_MUSAM|nr:unnamed protein product [Musa acuminata subsp. malaccensis]
MDKKTLKAQVLILCSIAYLRENCRKFIRLLPRASPYQMWSRSFSSENGNLVDAVVPFMGESIND